MDRLSENGIILKTLHKQEKAHPDFVFTKQIRDIIYLAVRASVDALNKINKEIRNETKK